MSVTPVVHDPVIARHRQAVAGELPSGVSISAAPRLKLIPVKHPGILRDGNSVTCWTMLTAHVEGIDPYLLNSPDVSLWLEMVIYRPKRLSIFPDPIRSPGVNRRVIRPAGFYHPADMYDNHYFRGTRGGKYPDPSGECRTEWKASGPALHDYIKVPVSNLANWFKVAVYRDNAGNSKKGVAATNTSAYAAGRHGVSNLRQTVQVRFRWAAVIANSTDKYLIHGPESETIYVGDPTTMTKLDFSQTYGTLNVLNDRHSGNFNLAAGFSPVKRLYVDPV